MPPPSDRRLNASPLDHKIQRSLTMSWREGIGAQTMISVMDTYMTPFALLLGASNAQIGWLVAIPNLLGSICQAFAVEAVEKAGSRLQLLVYGMAIQVSFLLPIGFLVFLPFSDKLSWLIALVAIYKTTSGVIGPAWGSLVSEYLPAHRRGDYFGWRSRILGLTTLCSVIFWGGFLYLMKKNDHAGLGFCLMFVTAAIARFISLLLMTKHADLPLHKAAENNFTFWMFLRRFRESNFVKFVFYVAGITFTTNLSAPYFSVHMLRDMHFDYLSFMLITLASTLTSLIAFPIWGRHADVIGNARILKITGWFIPFIPLLWLASHHVVPLFFVESIAGFIWGGFNLCAVNYIYDAVTPGKRLRCLGYFNLINGTAIFAGASIGGWLSSHLPPILGYPLLSLFVVSAVGRFLVHVSLSGKFKEVRHEVKKVSSFTLFYSVAGIRPLIGRDAETTVITPEVNFGSKPR